MLLSTSFDVVVIGGRCAGAATAMLLSGRGLDVLVVERGQYGTDALSTHALMRAGVVQLHRWGLLGELRKAGTPPVRSAAFHYDDEVVEVPVKPQDGVDGLYAPRRTVIDRILVDEAIERGVAFEFDTQLIDLVGSGESGVRGVRLRMRDGHEVTVFAKLVIGADGLHSTVARLVGAETYRIGRHATGVIFNYWRNSEVDAYHWYFSSRHVAAGVIPTNDDCVCIFVSMPQERMRDALRDGPGAGHRRLLDVCKPELAERLARSEPTERYRAFGGHVGFFRQSFGPGWALVGDAGYFKDPLTAHGITDALIDAQLLANAITDANGTLAGYQSARDAHATTLFDVSDAIASFDWDLTAVQQLHRTLSEELKRETHAVKAFGVPTQSV